VILTGAEMLGRLSEAVGALDQPSMDGINTYFVSWSARQAGLKVALSGLGGDEVFGGYSTFRRTPQYQRLATFSNQVPVGVRSAAASLAGSAGGRFMSGDAARKIEALLNSPRSLPDPFYFGRALFTPAQVSELMNGAPAVQDQPLWWQWLSESAAQATKLDPFAAVSCMELQSYLVSTLLRDTDSMSMAHSLEVRVPFLDHPLVEFVTQLPQEVKIGKGIPKALLVNALDDLLPSDVVDQKKRGFTFPWASWLRGPLKEKFERGLSELSPALQETLNSERVESVWTNYLDGKTTWSRPWSLYVLNEWTKRYLG
jgi:asparagine synthase (glutamine-hydrolysing)